MDDIRRRRAMASRATARAAASHDARAATRRARVGGAARESAARRRASGRATSDVDGASGRATSADAFDLGQAIGTLARGERGATLPPGRVGALGVRETLEYLADSNGFVRRRVERYGPIFKTALFFKPAIVFGSREAVREFLKFEGELPADEALPETFRELHTEYGALRMTGSRHAATRANFGKVLGRAALESYAPAIGEKTRDFVERLRGKETFRPGAECVDFALDLLFELFLGHVPEAKYKEAMKAYNGGLLSLGKWSSEFKAGKLALEDLTSYVEAHYRGVKARGELDRPEYFFYKQYSQAVDEFDEVFSDDRIATTCVLMVWGSYIEAAALMGHACVLLGEHDDARRAVLREFERVCCDDENGCRRIGTLADIMSMQYTSAVAKESLRVMPQTAGGLRVNPSPRKFASFDVPAGYVLTADPRIPFRDEANFPDPDAFKPERFVPGTHEAKQNDVSSETYYPGGMGQHQCPGISLATVMTQIFLAELVSAFPNGWRGKTAPKYVQVPIVILDREYEIEFLR